MKHLILLLSAAVTLAAQTVSPPFSGAGGGKGTAPIQFTFNTTLNQCTISPAVAGTSCTATNALSGAVTLVVTHNYGQAVVSADLIDSSRISANSTAPASSLIITGLQGNSDGTAITITLSTDGSGKGWVSSGGTGPAGAAGQSVTVAAESPGSNCATGGEKLTSASGVSYVCNGSAGSNGTSPTATVESAGANCTYGGVKFVSASGTNYACNGAPGSGGGTVTNIAAGTGLTGGPITSTGTLSVDTSKIPGKYFGTSAPGSVAGNLPGDIYTDTTGHHEYVCMAVSGTGAPACTSVATGAWTQIDGGGSSVSAGCGITVSGGSTVAWNPADMRNCTGIWEDFLGGSNNSNWGGSLWPMSTVIPTGTWTMSGPNPTVYSASSAAHIGTIKIPAPATADPQVGLAPINHFDYLRIYPQALEWTTAAIWYPSDVTYSKTKFGFFNDMISGTLWVGNAGIYMRYIPGTDTHMMGFICYFGTCDSVDFGAAPTAGAWQSGIIDRTSTGSSPKITMTWNGIAKTFCATGCDSTMANIPANTLQLTWGMQFGVAGTQSGIYWDIDAVALFFKNLGR